MAYDIATPSTAMDGFDAARGDSAWTRFRAGLSRFVSALQYARMCHTLSDLSDEQLRVIGIARRDIPRYAAECVDPRSQSAARGR